MKLATLSKTFLFVLAGVGLLSCTSVTPTSSAPVSEQSASSSQAASSAAGSSSSNATCVTDIDYTAQCKLTLDYKGHSFIDDGIGLVKLYENIDGDTTHFYMCDSTGAVTSSIIRSRYLCIDTPESTGKIQEWGKAASKFTASQINSAKTIVLSSDAATYGKAKADSTGSRYLSYIWVSDKENPELTDFRLLNLLIVQNGYSTTKSATDTMYYDYFYKADKEAQCAQLHIWSKSPDPDFNYNSATETTLQDIYLSRKYDETKGDYVTYDWTLDGQNKVAFDCYVAATADKGSCYVYNDYPDVTDASKTVRYGLFIFSGYSYYTPFEHVGWKINAVGYLAFYPKGTNFDTGTIQLTGVNYSVLSHNDGDTSILDRTGTTYTAPTVSAGEAADKRYTNVVINVQNLVTYRVYVSDPDSETQAVNVTLYCKDATTGDQITVRFPIGLVKDRVTKKVIESADVKAYFVDSGDIFQVTAPLAIYSYTISGSATPVVTYQLALLTNADLVFNS